MNDFHLTHSLYLLSLLLSLPLLSSSTSNHHALSQFLFYLHGIRLCSIISGLHSLCSQALHSKALLLLENFFLKISSLMSTLFCNVATIFCLNFKQIMYINLFVQKNHQLWQFIPCPLLCLSYCFLACFLNSLSFA